VHKIDSIKNKILKGDCIESLKKIPSGTVDLIFADPPYNMQLEDGKELYRDNGSMTVSVFDHWDKFDTIEEYDTFCKAWLSEAQRVLKDDGAIWVIGSYHNIFRLGYILQDLGYWILNDVIWMKSNPKPNFKGTRFNNAHETLIWASKSKKSKYTFNYKALKIYNDDLQMRSDWIISICSGNERLKDSAGDSVHHTQKPEELLYRVILSTTNKGDLVVDPFFGSGTTGAVCKRLGRDCIGLEREPKYIEAAINRINAIVPLADEYLTHLIEEPPPKIAFGTLLVNNMLQVGETLYSSDKAHQAIIKANGAIEYNEGVGSIHSVCKSITNKTSSNGWKYWFVERDGILKCINDFRYSLAEKLKTFSSE